MDPKTQKLIKKMKIIHVHRSNIILDGGTLEFFFETEDKKKNTLKCLQSMFPQESVCLSFLKREKPGDIFLNEKNITTNFEKLDELLISFSDYINDNKNYLVIAEKKSEKQIELLKQENFDKAEYMKYEYTEKESIALDIKDLCNRINDKLKKKKNLTNETNEFLQLRVRNR